MTMYSFFKISLIAMLVITTIANYLFIEMFISGDYVSLGKILMFMFCIVFETLIIQKLFKL